MSLRILHLSDTHLYGDAESRHYGVVDTTAALDRVLARAADVEGVDLVVLSGDLSEDGTAAAYRKLRDRIEPFAAERGAAVAYVMGNHDLRDGFEAVLGERVGAVDVKGWRVLRLDSAVPGAGYGEIGPEQLRWLAARLAEVREDPAVLGAVVVLHHPPVPAWAPLLQALELQNRQAVAAVIADGGSRLVLAGHYHHAVAARAAGVPVVVAPGITNTSDAVPPAGHERAAIGSGFAVIDLPEPGEVAGADGAGEPAITFIAAPSPDDGTWLFDLGPEQVAQIAAQAGPQG